MWINLLVIMSTIALGLHYMRFEKIFYTVDSLGNKHSTTVRGSRKKYIWVITLLLILQSGLRHVAVGADTYQYSLVFERVKSLSWAEIFSSVTAYYDFGEGKDPGYLVFQKIFQYISGDYQVYLFFVAILFFSALGYFIYKNTRRVSDVLFAFVLYSTLFYAMFSITGIRQTLATAAALWGYELIKRKKLLSFLLLILLASTIHKSVLIFIPLYFIRSPKALKYLLICFAMLLPLMFAFSGTIAVFFQSMDDTYAAYGYMENLKPYNYVILNMLIFFMGMLTYKASQQQTIYLDTRFWYAALLLATFFTTQVFAIHGFMRVIYYFSIFNLLLIPHMITLLARKWKLSHRQLMTWAIIVLLALYLRGASGSEYKFFWQMMELGENYR